LTETGSTPSTYSNSAASNRVNSVSGALARTYGYDSAGNTLSYAGATFTYNNRGRMLTASNGGVTASYTYNALGQRIRRSTSTATTLYVYDEAGHLAGEYTAAGGLIQETVWLGDTPVATLRPNGSGGVVLYYVHADHLDTPRLVTDTGNIVRWSWESDAFGTTVPNGNPAGLGSFEYNLRFPGQQYDAVVGLHYNYYRNLDPATGRYVESDPIGLVAGVNTYAYVLGAPTHLADPFGLDWIEYTGEKINWYGGNYPDRSQPGLWCWARSGRDGYQLPREQNNPDRGPVPEGGYTINLRKDPNRVAGLSGGTLAADTGIQRIPTTGPDGQRLRYIPGNWGSWRARLEPDVPGDRYSFYIHNSRKGQTKGCIETCDDLLDELLKYRKRNDRIRVYVDYTGAEVTRGSMRPEK
jgi:RHS repeat-associated protein